MDKNTFGSSKGAENLVSILEEQDDKTRHNASRMMVKFLKHLREAQHIKDEGSRRYISNLILDEFKQKIVKYPIEVTTHMRSVAVTAYRKALA